jgi:hypothetical protein
LQSVCKCVARPAGTMKTVETEAGYEERGMAIEAGD